MFGARSFASTQVLCVTAPVLDEYGRHQVCRVLQQAREAVAGFRDPPLQQLVPVAFQRTILQVFRGGQRCFRGEQLRMPFRVHRRFRRVRPLASCSLRAIPHSGLQQGHREKLALRR